MPKRSIRIDMLTRRRQLPAELSLVWSQKIQSTVLQLPEFRTAARVALYSPVRNEVATAEIFRAGLEVGKQVVYPRVREHRLEFVAVSDGKELQEGAFGIAEPHAGTVVPLGSIDLLIVPGLAFDLAGHRLGYGKGFYDRMLHDPEERGILIGLCYEMQVLESLPAAAHDIRMDLLVTENRVLRLAPDAARSRYPIGGGLT